MIVIVYEAPADQVARYDVGFTTSILEALNRAAEMRATDSERENRSRLCFHCRKKVEVTHGWFVDHEDGDKMCPGSGEVV